MAQSRRGGSLASEAVGGPGLAGELRPQGLQGDVTAEEMISGAVDSSRPTLTQEFQELIAIVI